MLKGCNYHWYLLSSKLREEQRAFDNLTSQGHEVFLPKIPKIKKRQGIKSASVEPLFPNYLFIHLDTNEANFNAIRSTRGVRSFVKFGLNYATLSETILNKIKQTSDAADSKKHITELLNLNAGDSVEISEGPFKGLQAIYQCKDGLERSVLLIKMLGQENQVIIDNQLFDIN